MKRLKYLLLASLVAFAACDEEETGVELNGAVRVTVTAGSAPLPGVTVSLGAAGTAPVTTGADGIANFTEVPVGTYTVTVTGLSADVICSSTTQPVTVASGQTTAVQFACNTVRTSSISGTVAFANGLPLPNAAVTVTRTLPAPADPAVNLTTNAQGQYSLTGLRSGTFTVTLAATTGCTAAATTQTVTVAAGEARVVNFTCTQAPPPVVPATVAIQSITMTVNGQQVPVPSNALRGIVNVNLGIEEGDQKVSRLRLRLGTETVCDQTFVAAAPEMELATFNVVCPVNTAAFDLETGAPDFLNDVMNLVADIFTVAGGSTTAVHTATLSVDLTNQDATYATFTAERTALSTTSSRVGAGLTWQNGDVTIRALPVMYSGIGVQSVTVSFLGGVPSFFDEEEEEFVVASTNLPQYLEGERIRYTVSRLLEEAPYTTTLSSEDDINDDDDPFDDGNGVNLVEDTDIDIEITVLRADGQPGPNLEEDRICTGGVLPSVNFEPTGCADGQQPNDIRVDNFAPVVAQVDRALRWSPSYAYAVDVTREDDDLDDYFEAEIDFNGVTGWIHEEHEFDVTRLLFGEEDPLEENATAPRAADIGVGLPASGFFTYMAGLMPTEVEEVETGGDLEVTEDNDTYYLGLWVSDVFGAMDVETNTRVRFYDNSVEGVDGTDEDDLEDLLEEDDVRFGVDDTDPCFTEDGLVCAEAMGAGSELRATGDVIGTAGELTVGAGGVRDGWTAFVEVLDLENSAGGLPGYPENNIIARIRREYPEISSSARCVVGFGTSCTSAGASTGSNARRSGIDMGINSPFDFETGDWNWVDPLTGGETAVNDVADLVGYYLVEVRAVENAGNESGTLTRRFVRDIVEPVIGGGVSFTPSVAPNGQIQFQTNAQDDLELDRVDLYMAYSSSGLAFRHATNQVGEFGPTAYTGNPLTTGPVGVSSGTFRFVHEMEVIATGTYPATVGVFRVYDFGRNVAESLSSGVPLLNPGPDASVEINTASLFAAANELCWDSDNDGCDTATSTTIRFQVEAASQPFTSSNVTYYVGQDANNDGVIDLDSNDNQLWNPVPTTVTGSSSAGVYTYTRTITGEAIAIAARRTTLTGVALEDVIHIRAVGVRANGSGFTTAAGTDLCPAAAGTNQTCTIQLLSN
jgi:hypothetical protein